MLAQKGGSETDVKKTKTKNEVGDNNRKRLIEDDFQRSDIELETRNTKTDNWKRTFKMDEKVVEDSLDFQNDCGMKRNNGKDNGDDIADENIKCKRKRMLKKHEPQGDNQKKVDSELCSYGPLGNGDQTAIGNMNSKQRRSQSNMPQGDNKKKVDAESCGYVSQENVDAITIDKTKSERKKRSKKREPQSANAKKIDPEACCYDFDIGFVEDKLLADGQIKSKEKKKKAAVEDKMRENGNDAETSKFKLKKTGPEVHENVVQVGVRYVSTYFHNDGAKKIDGKQLDNERNSEPIALPTSGDLMGDDKLEEDGIGVPTNQQGLEGFVDSVVLTTTPGDFFEDELKENGSEFKSIGIKSKRRRSNSHQTAEEIAKVRKVSPDFQIDDVKKAVEDEALDHDNDFVSVALMGTCGYMVQDKEEKKNGVRIAIEKIKSKGKRKHKLEPAGHVDADSCCEIGSIASPGIGSCFLGDKLLKDGNKMDNGPFKVKKMMKKNKAFTNKLQQNGNDAETVKPKKVKYVVQKNIIQVGVRYVSPFFHNDIGKKFNVQPLNKKSKSESMVLPAFQNFMEDKLLEDNGEKNVKLQVLETHADSVVLTAASGDSSENELQKNRKKIETIKVKSKIRKSNGRRTAEEHAKVRKVSPYFQNDTKKTANVKAHDHESDRDSLSLVDTCTFRDKTPIEKFKYEGKDKHAQIRKVSPFFQSENVNIGAESRCHGSEIGFHALTAPGGGLPEHKLLEDGNVIENGMTSFKKKVISYKLQENGNDATTSKVKPKKTKPLVQKNMAHGIRYVSPYFHNASGKKSNVKPLDKKSKSGSIALHTFENFLEDTLEGNKSTCSEKSIEIKQEFNIKDEAYKRKTPDNTWKPPRSTISLIQEDHLHDPWRVLVICVLLNRTTGEQVKKVLPDFFKLCPDAKSCTQVAREEIVKTIQSLGLHKRAETIQRLSEDYLYKDWRYVTELHGVGKYGADAYAILVTGMWDRVTPSDHKLYSYWEFLHSIKHEL